METLTPRERAAQNYGKRLRTALEESGTSIYRLSRKLNPQAPESARSNIQRYLRGEVLPGIESRAALADALGINELRHVPEDDEEESEPMLEVRRLLLRVLGIDEASARGLVPLEEAEESA